MTDLKELYDAIVNGDAKSAKSITREALPAVPAFRACSKAGYVLRYGPTARPVRWMRQNG